MAAVAQDAPNPHVLSYEKLQELARKYHIEMNHPGRDIIIHKLKETYLIVPGQEQITKMIGECETCQRVTSVAKAPRGRPMKLLEDISFLQKGHVWNRRFGLDFGVPSQLNLPNSSRTLPPHPAEPSGLGEVISFDENEFKKFTEF